MRTTKGVLLIVGCSYHIPHQIHKNTTFLLDEIDGDRAKLKPKISTIPIWVNVDDLIFINTKFNRMKANKSMNNPGELPI
jgi:hypothetical protein